MQRNVTIADVAARAGVSTATVSRFLAGKTVRANLAMLVQRSVEELEYRPNRAARDLASGEHSSIGVFVPDLANPYFNEVLKEITAAARSARLGTLVADSNEVSSNEMEVCRNLRAEVRGLIVVSPRMPESELWALAREEGPLVVVNRLTGAGIRTVAVDAHRAMLEICGHLRSLGHQDVAYLAGPIIAWQESERVRALETMNAFGLNVRTIPTGVTMSEGYDAAEQALEGSPTALIGNNDLVAIGAIKRLHQLGLRVPDDISVTGTDNVPFGSFIDPELTTAAVPRAELGVLAWEELRAEMSGEDVKSPRPLIRAPLLVRASTGPARQARTGPLP